MVLKDISFPKNYIAALSVWKYSSMSRQIAKKLSLTYFVFAHHHDDGCVYYIPALGRNPDYTRLIVSAMMSRQWT